MKTSLLLIDPQNDFCSPDGSLYVPGAEKDISRLAGLIKRLEKNIASIHVTMDTHHYVDVAYPIYWKNSKGEHPDPFTTITKDQVLDGTWVTTQPSLNKRALDYVTQLETNGRYPLTIWPPHCLIGSNGHAVHKDLYDALIDYEKHFNIVQYVTKGSNPYTEHYSAIKADVIDPKDPTTQRNTPLIELLEERDMIIVAGQALSHCVANTVRDVVDGFSNDEYAKKIVILEDASSSVPGFEDIGTKFLEDMANIGVKISTTDKVLM